MPESYFDAGRIKNEKADEESGGAADGGCADGLHAGRGRFGGSSLDAIQHTPCFVLVSTLHMAQALLHCFVISHDADGTLELGCLQRVGSVSLRTFRSECPRLLVNDLSIRLCIFIISFKDWEKNTGKGIDRPEGVKRMLISIVKKT